MARRQSAQVVALLSGALVLLIINGASASASSSSLSPLVAAAASAAPAARTARRALRQQSTSPPPPATAARTASHETPPPPLPPSADDVPWSWTSWRTYVALLVASLNAFTAAATGQGGAPILVAIAVGILQFTVADAAAFSAAVLTAGALPSLLHALSADHPLFPKQIPLVDWRTIALTTPPMLVGVMLGAMANDSFPSWLLSLVMVALFSAAALDMLVSYAHLLSRERERDALLRRLDGHVAAQQEEEEEEEEAAAAAAAAREQQEAVAAREQQQRRRLLAGGVKEEEQKEQDVNAKAAFALGSGHRRHSLDSNNLPPSTSAGTLAPGELRADLDRLRLLTRQIARGEAQALNPALLCRTFDGELEAAFQQQRRAAAASGRAGVVAAAAAAGREERLGHRRSSGASSLDPQQQQQHSLELVIEGDEKEEGEEEEEEGQRQRQLQQQQQREQQPHEQHQQQARGLAAAAAPAPGPDDAAANLLVRRVVAVKREHDERVARAKAAARVQAAALDDARYHAAVDKSRSWGRSGGGGAKSAESKLASMRSARSASNAALAGGASITALRLGRSGGGGGSGLGATSTTTAAGATRNSGESGGVGRAGSTALLARPPSAAISARSNSRTRLPSFGVGGGAAAAPSSPSPFAPLSRGSATGGGSASFGARSSHSDVLSVSPFLAQLREQAAAVKDEDDDDDLGVGGRDGATARDQQQRARPPAIQPPQKKPPPPLSAAAQDDDDDDLRKRKDDDDNNEDDGRVAPFIVKHDGDVAAGGSFCSPLLCAVRAWWSLLPGPEAATTLGAFLLFVLCQALDKGLFGNRACSTGSLALRLVFVGLMVALTAATLALLVSADRKMKRRSSDADHDDEEGKGKTAMLPAGAELGRHEAAVSWTPMLVAGALPLSCLIGALGGAIGASGVVISSAVLLRLGGHPQVVAASNKITLFTSVSATTVSLALEGRLNVPYAAAAGLATLLATPLGQWLADGLVRRARRPSLIVLTNALRFAAGVAAIVAVALVPELMALARGDPTASRFRPVCGGVV